MAKSDQVSRSERVLKYGEPAVRRALNRYLDSARAKNRLLGAQFRFSTGTILNWNRRPLRSRATLGIGPRCRPARLLGARALHVTMREQIEMGHQLQDVEYADRFAPRGRLEPPATAPRPR